MLKMWIILAAASCAVSAVPVTQKDVLHGDDLTLDVPDRTESLKFISADEKRHVSYWKRAGKVLKGQKLHVASRVTFDNAGTYTLLNARNKEISSYTVKVRGRKFHMKCVPGETLKISLNGIKLENATLLFNSNGLSVTLVKSGEPVASRDPNYINRLKVTSQTINVLNVNVSDLGEYILKDHKRRTVSNSALILVERHSTSNKKALIALVLLVIPVISCCYCMIKFCCTEDESNTANTNTLNAQPESVPMCQTVTDPSKCYPTLPVQGQIQCPPPQQWNGQPAVPPYPNPAYPPGPLGPPAQPPQLNVPPNQYYPPANYNPLMNSASPGLYPTTPLL